MTPDQEKALSRLAELARAKASFTAAFKECLELGCNSVQIARATGVTKQAVQNRKKRMQWAADE